MRNSKGFTLIELMVAISIVAVLAVIGFTVFSGMQKSARDSRRQTEIQSIATAMETHYQASGGKCGAVNLATAKASSYCNLADDWFNTTGSSGVPTDPIGTTNYCLWVGTAGATVPANPAHWTSACPATDYTLTPANGVGETLVGGNQPNFTLWKVCASMESSDTVYCKQSSQN